MEGFEHLVLRAVMNGPTNPLYCGRTHPLPYDMGQAASQGNIIDLYLNGRCQGYYNPVERIDSNFLRPRHGGGNQWDEIRQGEAIEWNRLKRAVVGPDFSITDNYAGAVQQLDIDNFIDDTMLNVYTALND